MAEPENLRSKKARSAAIARLRSHLATRVASEELWSVIDDYDKRRASAQTEGRATALVLGAILEQSLETAIMSHCIALDEKEQRKLFSGGEDGPMNFAVKIRLAFALGIYGEKSRDQLDIIRNIRNVFAHDKGHLHFDDGIVAELCNQLRWAYEFDWVEAEKAKTPQNIFIETVKDFVHYFNDGHRFRSASLLGTPLVYRGHDWDIIFD
jgi:hypothetical protein